MNELFFVSIMLTIWNDLSYEMMYLVCIQNILRRVFLDFHHTIQRIDLQPKCFPMSFVCTLLSHVSMRRLTFSSILKSLYDKIRGKYLSYFHIEFILESEMKWHKGWFDYLFIFSIKCCSHKKPFGISLTKMENLVWHVFNSKGFRIMMGQSIN